MKTKKDEELFAYVDGSNLAQKYIDMEQELIDAKIEGLELAVEQSNEENKLYRTTFLKGFKETLDLA